MSDDPAKPLHVKVAEALGWTDIEATHPKEDSSVVSGWLGVSPDEETCAMLPRYDTDWSATGPLVEKYRMWVFPDNAAKEFYWEATCEPGPEGFSGEGPTPLVAVCELVLALKEVGKL